MYNPRMEVEPLLKGTIDPIKFSLWFHHCERENALCLYSDHPKFKTYEEKSIYEIPPLLRYLLITNKTLERRVLENYFKSSAADLCFIANWSDLERVIIIFDLEKLSIFDEEEFATIIHQSRGVFKSIFQKSLYQYLDNK